MPKAKMKSEDDDLESALRDVLLDSRDEEFSPVLHFRSDIPTTVSLSALQIKHLAHFLAGNEKLKKLWAVRGQDKRALIEIGGVLNLIRDCYTILRAYERD